MLSGAQLNHAGGSPLAVLEYGHAPMFKEPDEFDLADPEIHFLGAAVRDHLNTVSINSGDRRPVHPCATLKHSLNLRPRPPAQNGPPLTCVKGASLETRVNLSQVVA